LNNTLYAFIEIEISTKGNRDMEATAYFYDGRKCSAGK
jgi:hypothetical protein